VNVIDEQLAQYLAERGRQRDQRTQAVLDKLTPFERKLAGELAVMGWVRGFLAARAGATEVSDDPKLPIVVTHCLGMPDLYPVLATLDDGFRPGDDGFLPAYRRHAGLDSEEDE
jgi:hypothetical protein